MKKIVFVIPDVYHKGGIARVTNLIINKLLTLNLYDIQVVSLSQKNGEFFYPIDQSVKIISLPFNGFDIRKNTLQAVFKLKKLFKTDFQGTFIIDDVGHNIPVWLGLKHCKKAKFISWSHMNFFNGSKYGFSGWGKRLAVKKFNYLVVLTKEDKSYYDKILKATNVVQIYNPIDDNIVKQNYALDSHKIISCGRLDKIKGFDLLIEVARNVFKEISDWQWDIYGDGPEKENLQQKINKYGLTDKVHLMGYKKNIYEIYQKYAFYVFTSRGEGCPMTMIEAQSSKLPMISFDFKCGPKDLITEGENGFIIHNWNLREMAEKIKMLMNDRELRIKFSANADMNLSELKVDYIIEQWTKIL